MYTVHVDSKGRSGREALRTIATWFPQTEGPTELPRRWWEVRPWVRLTITCDTAAEAIRAERAALAIIGLGTGAALRITACGRYSHGAA